MHACGLVYMRIFCWFYCVLPCTIDTNITLERFAYVGLQYKIIHKERCDPKYSTNVRYIYRVYILCEIIIIYTCTHSTQKTNIVRMGYGLFNGNHMLYYTLIQFYIRICITCILSKTRLCVTLMCNTMSCFRSVLYIYIEISLTHPLIHHLCI